MKNLFLIFLLLCFISCNKGNNKYKTVLLPLTQQSITISNSDLNSEEIKDGIFELYSYIKFSEDELIGNVDKILIQNNRIFILDSGIKILCFDLKGNFLFKIDNRGQGPGDYANIRDFSINAEDNLLYIYDDYTQKILLYDLETSEYSSDMIADFMSPTEIATTRDGFYFKNMDKRFKSQESHPYYLLYSESAEKIDKTFLDHDIVSEYQFDMKSFFYNHDDLLFCKPFDNIVYLLGNGEITPLLTIELPSLLPIEKIENRMPHWEIPLSGYSYGIGDVYILGNILHFTFSKDGFVVTTFYDLEKEEVLCCSNRVLYKSRKNLPFYSLINGVYKDKFFSVVSTMTLTYMKNNSPEHLPKDLLNIEIDDNPILAFYKVLN